VLAQVHNQLGNECPDIKSPHKLKALFDAIQQLNSEGRILAYHDRSDGGVAATAIEMAFAGNTGVTLYLDALLHNPRNMDVDGNEIVKQTAIATDHSKLLAALFNEELGVVMQVRREDRNAVLRVLMEAGLSHCSHVLGHLNDKRQFKVFHNGTKVLEEPLTDLRRAWSETSHLIQKMRDNPVSADAELAKQLNESDPGLHVKLSYDINEDVAAPFIATNAKPRIAILREQGVNGQLEMAAAFDRAGFAAFDVHMSDIISGRVSLADFKAFTACGGFSYGDVLGAGEGWAKSILFNSRARDEFQAFFNRKDTFALGMCNGCQMMSNLKELIPGAENWPYFRRNASEQYEARFVMVEVQESPSIVFADMAGSRMPIAVAHGEGRAVYTDKTQMDANRWLVAMRFVDNHGKVTEAFPYNSNGSPQGVTAVTTADGRFTVMMPHPERVFRAVTQSWKPDGWVEDSPWMRLFRNARKWLG
jgi:phosphoribosylformylglycinamidine synthase